MVTAALVSDTLQSVGAVGGLLSIVGTGLLILLVASQSRQIRAMREWIEQEPQRQAETAQRVIAEVQRRIAAARERREGGPGVTPPAVSAAGAAVKPAPGTLGATPEAKKIAAEKAALAPTPPGAPSVGPPGIEPPRFAPLTPAGEAAVDGDPAVVSESLGQETQVSDVLPDAEFEIPSVGAGRGNDVRFGEDQFDLDEEHPRSNRWLFGGGIAILVIGVILLATQLFGGGGSKTPATAKKAETPKTNGGGTTKPKASPTPAVPARADVPVLVFNATTTTGLGKNNSDALRAKGYQIVGPPQTWSPSLTSTSIMYRPTYKPAALEVAKDLGFSSSVVSAIDANTSVQAGQAAKVVVKAVTNPSGASATTGTTG